jgi:hypothetical protein
LRKVDSIFLKIRVRLYCFSFDVVMKGHCGQIYYLYKALSIKS